MDGMHPIFPTDPDSRDPGSHGQNRSKVSRVGSLLGDGRAIGVKRIGKTSRDPLLVTAGVGQGAVASPGGRDNHLLRRDPIHDSVGCRSRPRCGPESLQSLYNLLPLSLCDLHIPIIQ